MRKERTHYSREFKLKLGKPKIRESLTEIVTESFSKILKTEFIYHYQTKHEATLSVFEHNILKSVITRIEDTNV